MVSWTAKSLACFGSECVLMPPCCCPEQNGVAVEYAKTVCEAEYPAAYPLPISVHDEGIVVPNTSRFAAPATYSVSEMTDQAAFSVHIDARSSDDLGLDVDDSSGSSLLVLRVHDGVFQEWNEAHPEFLIQHGDRIVGVNGVRGDAQALLQKLRNDDFLLLALEKPAEFLLRVERLSGSDKIGVDVSMSLGNCLVVRQALVDYHNGLGGKTSVLRTGDRIKQVNDINGDAAAMLDELAHEPCVDIRFCRWEPDWNVERHVL